MVPQLLLLTHLFLLAGYGGLHFNNLFAIYNCLVKVLTELLIIAQLLNMIIVAQVLLRCRSERRIPVLQSYQTVFNKRAGPLYVCMCVHRVCIVCRECMYVCRVCIVCMICLYVGYVCRVCMHVLYVKNACMVCMYTVPFPVNCSNLLKTIFNADMLAGFESYCVQCSPT